MHSWIDKWSEGAALNAGVMSWNVFPCGTCRVPHKGISVRSWGRGPCDKIVTGGNVTRLNFLHTAPLCFATICFSLGTFLQVCVPTFIVFPTCFRFQLIESKCRAMKSSTNSITWNSPKNAPLINSLDQCRRGARESSPLLVELRSFAARALEGWGWRGHTSSPWDLLSHAPYG